MSPRHTAWLALILLGFGMFLGAAAGPQSTDTLAANPSGSLNLRLPPIPATAPAPPAPAVSEQSSPPPSGATTPPTNSPAPVALSSAAGSTSSTGASSPSIPGSGVTPGAVGLTTPNVAARPPIATGSTPVVDPPVPHVHHVFLISLADQGYAGAFASPASAPYLDETLVKQGTLLTNFYAIAHGSLPDDIALISGQGPNPQTQSGCPTYSDVTPGKRTRDGQVAGQGCVYPVHVRTLADQLTAGGRTWRAYMEDSANGGPGVPMTCRHPPLGSGDTTGQSRPGDAYATMRNPFVYFHSIIDSPACVNFDVGLEHLNGDLALGTRAPALSYIVPNLCHDGSATTCPNGGPAGMMGADAFLKTWVPAIMASSAYRDGGMLAILPDQAPASGPGADSGACCDTPAFPSTANAGGILTPGQGGGKVGLLVLSPFVRPAAVVASAYNDFSLLRTLENIFGRRHLGYAARPDVQSFGSDVWTVPSTRTTGQRAHRRRLGGHITTSSQPGHA